MPPDIDAYIDGALRKMGKRRPAKSEFALRPQTTAEEYNAARAKGLTPVHSDKDGFIPLPNNDA